MYKTEFLNIAFHNSQSVVEGMATVTYVEGTQTVIYSNKRRDPD